MRNLTIKRSKSFVACLAKMKVYIEDNMAGDTTINDTPCRKLGTLKNGEEKTFQVENTAAKVFVIADRLSKSFCSEFYQLPEGEDDIILAGKNKFNLATGNAFLFDNNDNEDALENRKRNVKKGIIVLVAAAIVGGVIGFISGYNSVKPPKVESFTSEGMTVTLTDEFRKADFDGFTVSYESNDVVLLATKEAFLLYEGAEDISLEEYANLVIEDAMLDSAQVENADGLVGFEYEAGGSGDTFCYFVYVFKTDDAFWIVQFATPKEMAEENAPRIAEWARSVKFE